MKNIFLLFLLFVFISISAQQLPVFSVIQQDTSNAVKGYFFLTANDNLVILDKSANPVYYKPIKDVLDFTLEKKNMLFSIKEKTYIMDSTFCLIDSFACKNNVQHDPHDKILLPDGHLILLGSEKVKVDLNVYPEWKKKCARDTSGAIAVVLQEQDDKRNVVWEWHAKDHFALIDVDTFFDVHFCPPQWTHSNALMLDNDGNIILSSRDFDEITKINRKDGTIIWRFGGKHNQFNFVDCPVPFYGQHNIRRIANGHFTLFDDGQNIVPHAARALEFELDEINKIATLKWSYTFDSTVNSSSRGSVQRLPDGNTLINYGVTSGSDVSFVIVNPAGTKLFQVNYFHPSTFKVLNYSTLPFQLHRPVISCFDSAGVNYLDAGAGYKSYKWSTGDSTRTITRKNTGSYSVFVSYGDGGYICSERITITDMLKPCGKRPSAGKSKKQLKIK